jgi:hypothetical protein
MNAGLQAQVKTPARPSFTPLRTGLLQRKCACGGTPGRSGECEECREKRLNVQRRAAHEAESAIVDRALHALPTSTPSLAYNFATVPVYTPSPIRIQTKFGVNQPGDTYEQEADRVSEYVLRAEARAASDRNEPPRLSSAQTRVQRQEADEAPSGPTETTEPPAPAPETVPEPASPAETPTAGLLVEDEATELGPGQMNKSEFLDGLRAAVCAAADAELAAVGRSTEGCPYIEYWIGYYGTRSGDYIERAIRKYAPETAGVTTAGDYIPLITERIRHGVMTWATTGQITGVPEELASLAPGAGGLLAGAASAASGVVSGMGGLLFKARDGGPRDADPQAIQAQLRSGSPLDSGIRARMESAFGHDFSRVRVHTDGQAANLSSTVNARAFTIGSDIAFGAGEYQPGTLIGDALIAHELAHVVQQRRGSRSSQLSRQQSGGDSAFEIDADRSAAAAVAAMWQGAKAGMLNVGRNVMPRLSSGLSLQRCSKTQKATFKEFAPCSGFDDSTVPSSVMVPKGNNRVKAEIQGSIDFASNNSSIATVAPANSSSSPQTVTITGVAKGDTTVEARKAGGTAVLDTLKVEVKERKDKTLEIHGITDTFNAPNLVPANVPAVAALQTYLNDTTWGKQANVFFTVTRSDKNAAYDLDRNKKLADPVLVSATSAEINVISAAAKAGTDFNMYFINEMEVPHAFTDPGRAETWIQDTHVNSTENVAAHELGHALGIPGESNNADDVMLSYGAASNPCRIRETDWNTVNP